MIERSAQADHKTRRTQLAILELVFAGSLWGFGFVAAIWTLRAWGPLSATGIRFALALVVGGVISCAVPALRANLNWKTLKLAFIPGLFLSITLVTQTWGLKYTTATKSGFLTCLYVLLVPLLERLWLKRKLPRFHFVFVLTALLGVALICDLAGAWNGSLTTTDLIESRLHWNIGDVLTLFCALAASCHILWFGKIAAQIESSFVFNLAQSFWAAIVPITFGLVFEKQPAISSIEGLPLVGLFMLACGSTLIAFALQIRAQKHISPSVASLLFLLESPFATVFAIYFLSENLRHQQWVGAGLIVAAVALSAMFGSEVSDSE